MERLQEPPELWEFLEELPLDVRKVLLEPACPLDVGRGGGTNRAITESRWLRPPSNPGGVTWCENIVARGVAR